MIHIVTGGSASGKSAFAEEQIKKYQTETESAKLYYIATMKPYGAETEAKIERHRRMRAGKGFETVECYNGLDQTAKQITVDKKRPCVLLECMSNLAANEIFEIDGAGEHTEDAVIRGVRTLCEKTAHVVIVTNEVFSECSEDTKEMKQYKNILGAINCRMAKIADEVTELVYGIPIRISGQAAGGNR